jgi:hypothetical protein
MSLDQGATTYDITTDYIYADTPNLIDATQGDHAFLSQLVTRQSPSGLSYQSLTKIFRPADFTMTDGQPQMLSGAFQDVPQTGSITLNDVRTTQFDAAALQIHPGSTSMVTVSDELGIYVTSGGVLAGDSASWGPSVLEGAELPAADGSAGTFTYGDPFPPDWARIAFISYQAWFTETLPGGGHALLLGWIAYTDQLGALPGTLAPLISPARDLHVGGMAAQNDVTGIGLSPELSWGPPAQGTVSGYIVNLLHLTMTPPSTKYLGQPAATFYTMTTSLTIPPGILQQGEHYYVRLDSYATPGFDLGTHPYRMPLPYASASLVSGVLSP